MAENEITNPDHPDHPEWGPQSRRKAREARERKAFERRIADSMERNAHILDRLADGPTFAERRGPNSPEAQRARRADAMEHFWEGGDV